MYGVVPHFCLCFRRYVVKEDTSVRGEPLLLLQYLKYIFC